MHLTGRYPAWWDGKEFTAPVVMWAAGVTSEVTRDSVQRTLMGRVNAIGTGAIPKDAIKEQSSKRGVADAIDTAILRHGGGADVQAGQSILTFKSYDQGRAKFQSETLDAVWLDEECGEDIYTEVLTRTNVRMGPVYCTFTPLLGMTNVVHRFLLEPSPNRIALSMTIDDALHYTPEQRAAIVAGYPAHEREARTKGIPMRGSGLIFPVSEDRIKVEGFPIPAHWKRICGMDFGWDHPTAGAWLAHDADTDTIYVYDAYRVREAPVVIHAAAFKARGAWIPVAWPHDGNNDTAAGPNLASQYRAQSVAMRTENAQFPETPGGSDRPGSRISVEAGVQEMLTRMETGRWKVFAHLNDWFEEFRLYHRENGKIVKLRDDCLSASRYALMDLRFAVNKPAPIRGITMTGWRG